MRRKECILPCTPDQHNTYRSRLIWASIYALIHSFLEIDISKTFFSFKWFVPVTVWNEHNLQRRGMGTVVEWKSAFKKCVLSLHCQSFGIRIHCRWLLSVNSLEAYHQHNPRRKRWGLLHNDIRSLSLFVFCSGWESKEGKKWQGLFEFSSFTWPSLTQDESEPERNNQIVHIEKSCKNDGYFSMIAKQWTHKNSNTNTKQSFLLTFIASRALETVCLIPFACGMMSLPCVQLTINNSQWDSQFFLKLIWTRNLLSGEKEGLGKVVDLFFSLLFFSLFGCNSLKAQNTFGCPAICLCAHSEEGLGDSSELFNSWMVHVKTTKPSLHRILERFLGLDVLNLTKVMLFVLWQTLQNRKNHKQMEMIHSVHQCSHLEDILTGRKPLTKTQVCSLIHTNPNALNEWKHEHWYAQSCWQKKKRTKTHSHSCHLTKWRILQSLTVRQKQGFNSMKEWGWSSLNEQLIWETLLQWHIAESA